MSTHGDEDRLLAERAAEWLYRLETANRKEKAAFVRWLRESPRHVREILLAVAWERSLRDVDPNHKIDIDPPDTKKSNVTYLAPRLAAARRRPAAPPSAAPPEPPPEGPTVATNHASVRAQQLTPRRRRRRWCPPLVTLMRTLTLFLFALLLSAQPADQVIETGPAQWRTLKLNDGSVTHVGPHTKMIVEFNDGQRLVHLKAGEAIFTVAKDADRPFIVDTDMAAVRAIGTRFGVTRLAHQTEVIVAQGVVAVSTLGAPAKPGQLPQSVQASGGLQIIVDKAAQLETRQVDVDAELAWEHGFIVFTSVPIAQAIGEFNRRNLMQIQIPKDSRAKGYRITGKFRIDEPSVFSRYLREQLDRRRDSD